jgi:H+/gluconate symporter-like permease
MALVEELHAQSGDVLMVLGAFLGAPAGAFITLCWMEWRRLKRERRKDQAEAELMSAEGFPPPGPPTTDQPGT